MDSPILFPWIISIFWFSAVLRYLRDCIVPLLREPVLKSPVLIIESDDWGPGPAEDADVLEQLTQILTFYRDKNQHPAVMSLGIILSIPKGIQELSKEMPGGNNLIVREFLADNKYEKIHSIMKKGEHKGCFSLQLHGLDHFWHSSLSYYAGKDREIYNWLSKNEYSRTEELPSYLQGRWTDSSHLPSRRLGQLEVDEAVSGEVTAFKNYSRKLPKVVVPPAFIWTDQVERAWKKEGIRIVITPGKRFESYDQNGCICYFGKRIRNGQMSKSGLYYLVRDDYFEPVRGHKAEKGLAALVKKTAAGRSTLLETHRFNFIGKRDETDLALKELKMLLERSLQLYPDLLFMPPEKLGDLISAKDDDLISKSFRFKLPRWLARINEDRHNYLSGWLSGLTPILLILHQILKKFSGRLLPPANVFKPDSW